MTDLVTLGMAVDSRQVVSASKSLDQLTKSSNEAERAAGRVGQAFTRGSPAARDFQRSFADVDAAQAQMSRRANMVISQLTNEATMLRASARERRQLQAVQRAGVDVGSREADQIARLAGNLHDMEESMQRADRSGRSFAETLTRRLVFGYIAIQARHLATAAFNLNAELARLGDTAQRVGIAWSEFQTLMGAAELRGLTGAQFAEGMLKFAQNVDQAKRGVGELAELFRANRIQATDVNQAVEQLADLVAGASSEMQKFRILQAAGIPPTREWVRLFEGGRAGLAGLRDEAGNLVGLTKDQVDLAQEFEDRWNETWATWSRVGKIVVLEISELLNNLTGGFERARSAGSGPLRVNVRGLPGNVGPPPPPTVDPAVVRAQMSAEQQRIGILGELATVEDRVREKQIQINMANLAGAGISQQLAQEVLNLTRVQAEQARVSTRVSLGVATADEMRLAKQRELEIQVRNGTLSQDEATRALQMYERTIEETTDRMKEMGAAFPNLQRFENDISRLDRQLDQFAVTTLNSLSSSLVDMAMGTKSAGEAFQEFANNVLRALLEMIIRMTILLPIAQGLQAALGGFLPGGGARAGLGHGGGIIGRTPTRMVDPQMFLGAPRLHGGGMLGADEVPFIGRRGEEVGWPDDLRKKYGGGMVINMVTNNLAGADISTQSRVKRNESGGIDIETIIDRATAKNVVTPGSETQTALTRGGTLVRR